MAEARNQAPIIIPTSRAGESLVTMDRPIGDRHISPADIRKMQAVRRDEKAGLAAAQDEQDGLACASPEGFYESSVCQDAALRQEHRKLTSIFQALKDRGRADIEATEAAAWKQLRACKAKQCILDIYSEWNSYMIVNYTDVFVE